MNADVRSEQCSNVDHENCSTTAKSKRVTAAAWLAGVSAVVALDCVGSNASLGTGVAVLGISAMVALVCYFILRDK